jgi:2-polyprenyl-3-methyl-5-hydroxy-6-metoxy-1,4-benzoquinol methylase
MNMNGNSELYTSGQYAEKNPDWHVEESPWKAQQILRMLARHHLSPQTVGEVGCGAGEVLRQLQAGMDPACELWGYDISPYALELCSTRANARLHFKLADLSREPDVSFDLLLVLDVLEHLEDYFSFLRALQPKARYKVFHIPLDLSVQTVLRKNALLKRRDLHAHLHYFSKETALRTLADTGYQVLDAFYTPRSNELGTERVQKILNPVRRLLFALNADWAVRLLGGYSLLVLAS